MLKKSSLIILILALVGCASVVIPNYIQDVNPYKKKFYGKFDEVLGATTKTLEDFGWIISNTADPAVFERNRKLEDSADQQTLILTEMRQTAFFVGSRYGRINVYLRTSSDNAVEIELRYVTVTSFPFKNFKNYKNDGVADRIFKHIEFLLK